MNWIKWFGSYLQSPFLLLIRLYWGYQFFITGLGKFINHADVASYFETLKLPLPSFTAYAVGGVELIGGLLLFFGLFSRYAGLILFLNMCGAYATAYPDTVKALLQDFDPTSLFMKDPFLFAFASLLVFIFGPGLFSLDKLIFFRKKKELP